MQALIAEAMKNIDSNISAVHVEEAMDAVEDDLVDAVVEKAEKKGKLATSIWIKIPNLV